MSLRGTPNLQRPLTPLKMARVLLEPRYLVFYVFEALKVLTWVEVMRSSTYALHTHFCFFFNAKKSKGKKQKWEWVDVCWNRLLALCHQMYIIASYKTTYLFCQGVGERKQASRGGVCFLEDQRWAFAPGGRASRLSVTYAQPDQVPWERGEDAALVPAPGEQWSPVINLEKQFPVGNNCI